MEAALQGREAEQTPVFTLSAQHCQSSVIFFLLYFLIPLFAYSLHSQMGLVALDTWIGPFTSQHIFQHDTPAHLLISTRNQKLPKCNHHLFFSTPQNHSCYLCVVTHQQAWHTVPSGTFHSLQLRLLTSSALLPAAGIAAAVPKYKRNKCLKQAQELCSSQGKT